MRIQRMPPLQVILRSLVLFAFFGSLWLIKDTYNYPSGGLIIWMLYGAFNYGTPYIRLLGLTNARLGFSEHYRFYSLFQ